MTNDNNTRKKANAVFFSVIMVLSMVAVGFVAAPAAAAAQNIANGSADDVSVNQESVTQDVTFDVELNSGDSETIEVDLTPAADAGVSPSVNSVSSNDSTAVNVTSNGISDGVHTLTVNENASSTSNGTITVTYDHDTTGVAPTTGVDFDITAVDADQTTTATFALTDSRTSRVAGEKIAYNGSNVFQGEDDLTFAEGGGSGTTYSIGDLEGTAGNREGQPLDLPIDADTGRYATNGPSYDSDAYSVAVRNPRISTAEVQLNGDDVEQVATSRANNEGSRTFEVASEWNFDEAENVEITVEDEDGVDITDEVVSDNVLTGGDATEPLDLSDLDAGEYTVIFEASDDIDAEEEYTIETTSQDSVSLAVDQDTVTQGDNLGYTVSGAVNGEFHTLVIDDSDFRDGFSVNDAERVFRNVADTDQRGVVSNNGTTGADNASDVDYAYAVVEIDGTSADGSIRTGNLDDSSIDLDVYQGQSSATPDVSSQESVDDVTFDVEEGDVTLDSPTGTYTVGSEVDVSGTATSANDVGIYVRDNNQWEPVQIDGDQFISVDSDDTFSEEDVRLSQDGLGGNDILSFQGRYRIGVIDRADVDDESANIGTSAFSSASSNRYTITVEEGDLTAEFGTINGQIAQEDGEIDVEGTAAGQDDVVIAFVDRRGRTVATTSSVDSDDSFDEQDITIDSLSQGTVSGHVISLGRDAEVGNGEDLPGQTGATASDLESYIDDHVSGSGDQVRSRILANTVDADGSDDRIVSQTFRLNDATLAIRNVYPEEAQADGVNPVATGETMVVTGDTNRQSDIAAINVELMDQNDNSIDSTSTDEWGSDGQWSATLEDTDIDSGTYIIQADDGESTDRVEVEIVEERDTGGDGGETDDGESDDGASDDGSSDDGASDDGSGDDGSMDDGSSGDDSSGDDSSGDDSSSDDSSGDDSASDDTPGFGAIVALVALLAAALLATRRRD